MTKYKSMLLLVLLVICGSVFANLPWAGSNKTPVQVLEQASSDSKTAQKADSAANARPQGLKELPEASLQKDSLTAKQKPVAAKADAQNTATANVLKEEQEAINQINRTNIIYRQSVDRRIEGLTTTIQNMQVQLKQLDQALLLLNQEVVNSNKKNTMALNTVGDTKLVAHAATSSSVSFIEQWRQQLGLFGFYVVLTIIVLVLILAVWVFMPKSKKNISEDLQHEVAPMPDVEALDDTQGEYDYMGSNESIPAKLNLARAYIAMEDYNAAKKVIAEVLSVGNQEQCHEAQALRDEISRASA